MTVCKQKLNDDITKAEIQSCKFQCCSVTSCVTRIIAAIESKMLVTTNGLL